MGQATIYTPYISLIYYNQTNAESDTIYGTLSYLDYVAHYEPEQSIYVALV